MTVALSTGAFPPTVTWTHCYHRQTCMATTSDVLLVCIHALAGELRGCPDVRCVCEPLCELNLSSPLIAPVMERSAAERDLLTGLGTQGTLTLMKVNSNESNPTVPTGPEDLPLTASVLVQPGTGVRGLPAIRMQQ